MSICIISSTILRLTIRGLFLSKILVRKTLGMGSWQVKIFYTICYNKIQTKNHSCIFTNFLIIPPKFGKFRPYYVEIDFMYLAVFWFIFPIFMLGRHSPPQIPSHSELYEKLWMSIIFRVRESKAESFPR